MRMHFATNQKKLGVKVAMLACAVIVMSPLHVHADVLWDNDLLSNGVFCPCPTDSAWHNPQWDGRHAEDFHVPPGGWVLQDFHIQALEDDGWTSSGITNITIFRADGTTDDGQVYYEGGTITPVAGGPGSIFTQFSAPYSRTPTGQIIEWGPFNPMPVYQYDAVFADVFIPEGSYYISWRDDVAAGVGYCFWQCSSGGDHPNTLLGSVWLHSLSLSQPWRVYSVENTRHLAFLIGGTLPVPDLLGDLDDNGLVNQADVPHFVDALLGNPPANGLIIQARADMNSDAEWNGLDCALFVNAVLP